MATLNIKYFEISFANVVEQLWWKSLFYRITPWWWDLLRKLISIFMLGFFLESMHSIWIITMMSGSKSDSVLPTENYQIFFQILNSKFLIIASFNCLIFWKKKLATLLQSHKFQTILIKQWTDENAHSANIFGLNYFFSRSFLLRLLLQFYSVLPTSNYFMSKMGILQSWQHCIFQTHIMKNKAFTIIKFPTSIWKHN